MVGARTHRDTRRGVGVDRVRLADRACDGRTTGRRRDRHFRISGRTRNEIGASMNNTRELKAEVSRHVFLRDFLIANDPDLESDERTLHDTLEGLTDLNQILSAVIRSTLEDETIVG